MEMLTDVLDRLRAENQALRDQIETDKRLIDKLAGQLTDTKYQLQKLEHEQPLTFLKLQETNKQRCEQAFHSIEEWKPWDWSNAMAGEVGEACAEGFALLTTIAAKAGAACNITKKMARIWPANQFKQNWNKPEDQRITELEDQLADELADVVIYSDLLVTRIGRRLGDCVQRKFNKKSDEIGSSVKL